MRAPKTAAEAVGGPAKPRTARTEYANPPRLPEGAVDLPLLLRGDGPIELEIGPGRGMFLVERAAAEPNARLIGLEIRRKWACVVDARLAHTNGRARVFCEDGKLALSRLGPAGALARAFVHFPDPWWKKRHAKRLLIGPELLGELARLLAPRGELFIQTDVAERALRCAALCAHAQLDPAGDEPGDPRLSHNPYHARSNREKRADEDGLPIHRLRYHKRP